MPWLPPSLAPETIPKTSVMNSSLIVRQIPVGRRWLWLLASWALFLSGCTSTDVKDIVRESNYEMLLADTSATASLLPADAKDRSTATIDSALGRLETFIQNYPDKPDLTNPLRLRQALIYLSKGSFANADAAFDAIDPTKLHSARDQTIFAVHHSLSWWYEHAAEAGPSFVANQSAKAREVMTEFKTKAEQANGAPEMQDYLREVRAWIGLKLAGQLEGLARRQIIKDALDLYAIGFTGREEAILKEGKFEKDAPPFDRSIRRALRMDTLLDTAAGLAKPLPESQRPQLANAALQLILVGKINR